MNGKQFNQLKTAATDAKLKSLGAVYSNLERDEPPLRGFCIKYKKDFQMVIGYYNELVKELFHSIKNSKLSKDQVDTLLTGEQFQSDQKGPAAPVTIDSIQTTVIDDLRNIAAYEFSDKIKAIIDELLDELFSYFGSSAEILLEKINGQELGKKLPSTTVRGFPFHALGRDADETILSEGGSTPDSVLDYFLRSSQNVCFPGGRIQGKPWPGPAKVRIVNIPTVYYQYLMVGLTKTLMKQLTHLPMFDGWKEEKLRVSHICSMIDQASQDGFTCIQLDYSKFDRKIHPYIRNGIWKRFSERINDTEWAIKFYEGLRQYNENQHIFIADPKSKHPNLIDLPYQLLSGVIDTQLTGSITNAILQMYCARKLGFDLNLDYIRVLGDDAVFPVPHTLLNGIGYVEVLSKISEAVGELGFSLNPSKAYPNTDVAFLQKLYRPDLNIKGLGTGSRNIASFMFREKIQKKIKGINNLYALEMISQISIISQAFSSEGIVLENYAQFFADGGVEHDDGLRLVLQKLSVNGQVSENVLFKKIVELSGATNEQILDYLDLSSYDHTNLLEKLRDENYANVFKILKYIVRSSKIRNHVSEGIPSIFDDQLFMAKDQGDDGYDDIIDDM